GSDANAHPILDQFARRPRKLCLSAARSLRNARWGESVTPANLLARLDSSALNSLKRESHKLARQVQPGWREVTLSTSAVAPAMRPKVRASSTPIQSVTPPSVRPGHITQIDRGLVLGIVLAFGTTIAGISATAIGLSYFLQPAGALIVLGGTIGVILITTPT